VKLHLLNIYDTQLLRGSRHCVNGAIIVNILNDYTYCTDLDDY